MPCWYFDKKELKDTPSIQDGITFETERRYRKEGARFIMTCGTQMGIGHNTIATGVVYFHRFYMFHSFKSFPRYVTACCCLLLAGKVEETPKKCRDIIITARALLSDNYFYSFGKDPKEEVMTLERILLQTIKFDLQVEHPYTFLLKYAKCFKGDQQKLQKMVQMAWNFVNDSLSTVVCLQWEPEIIAVALIYLASKLSKFIVVDWVGRQPHHLRWWDMFVSDVTMEILEDICHQVLDLYQSNQKDTPESQSPPQKPPSRADSPTPMKAITSGSSSGSPAGKTKSTPTSTSTAAAPSTTATAPTNASNAMGEVNNIQTIKSLANPAPSAPIPPAAALPPPAVVGGAGDAITAAPIGPPGAAPYHHHMYGAPPPPLNPHHPPMHALNMYGSGPAPPPPPPHGYGAAPPGPSVPPPNVGNGTAAAPPPLPPQMAGSYVPPNANAWPGGPPTNAHHYPAVPPPPMPPTGPPLPGTGNSGNYYQGPTGYGRQPQQRY